jgi:hypothetical protein
MKVLVVRDAFGDYAVGAMIRDPEAMAAVEDAGQAHRCTVTEVGEAFFADEASPAAAPKAKAAPAQPDSPAASAA